MKLFVWVDPYRISYGSTMVFAVAENEASAREQIKVGRSYHFGNLDFTAKDIGGLSRIELGAPDRVVDLPCAEWHQWSE